MSLPLEATNIYTKDNLNYLKVPIAKLGKWYHELYGIIEFSQDDFNNIISNFNNKVLGHSPYLTYGHLDEEHHSTDSARKRGDFINLSIEGNTLYGVCEAKGETYESVKKEEYEFASAELIRNFKDKESGNNLGTVLIRTALTNSPFLPEMGKVEALSQLSTDYNFMTFSIATRVVSKGDNPMSDSETQESKTNESQENIDVPQPSTKTEDKQSTSTTEKSESDVDTNVNSFSNSNKESKEPKEEIESTGKESKEPKEEIESTGKESKESKGKLDSTNKESKEFKGELDSTDKESKEFKEEIDSTNKDTNNTDKAQKTNEDNISSSNESISNTDNAQKTNEDNISSSNESISNTNREGKSMPEEATKHQLPDIGPGELDINKIVKTLEAKIDSKYQQQLKEQQSLNQSLLEQLKEAKEDVEKERTTARTHQLSLSKAQQQVLEEHNRILADFLQGAGVSPVLIERFSQVKNAILGNQKVIKMSQGGQTQDLPITQALAELLVDAAQSETIKFSQQGVPNKAQYDPTGVRGSIEEAIRRNREIANKKAYK